MAFKDIKITDAGPDDLRWFLGTVLGVQDIPDGASSDLMRSKIREAGWGSDSIQINDRAHTIPAPAGDPAPAVVYEQAAPDITPANTLTDAQAARIAETSGKDDPLVTIFLPKQPGKGGDRAVPVGVNGTMILIPREQECKVPARYVKVLQHAVGTEYEQDEEGVIHERNVMSYPFNILEGREHVR